jgi:ribosomal protein S18 acetylase RimI-like enzyme
MSKQNAPIIIRASQLTDEPELIEICHLTGNPRVEPYLLALRWCLDYLWHDTENCFVAEDSQTGKVVGYIVGTLNTRQQEQRFIDLMLPKLNAHWRTIRPKTLKRWMDYLFIRSSLHHPYKRMVAEYPAHLHINIQPDYQRHGLGGRLFNAFEQNLIENGVTGYHLGVSGDNQVGISFYKKSGLKRLGKIPGFRHPMVIYYGRKLNPVNQAE